MTVATELITPDLAASVACAVTGESLEQFVAALPNESVPLYLARLTDVKTNVNALVKGLERRLEADGQNGRHWTFDGLEYGFYGSVQKGYRDWPELWSQLTFLGVPPVVLAEAITEARVTDIRKAIESIADPEKRQEALDTVEAHRVQKDERGAPRFQFIDPKYVTK